MNYVIFQSQGEPINQEQTTTRWHDSVNVEIALSGIVDGVYYNLMKMEGSIADWLAENTGKTTKVTKAEINALGAQIVPAGTTRTVEDLMTGEVRTYTAGAFDIDNYQSLWSE